MSATGVPSKALKVRPLAAKHYQLRHWCPLPNSLDKARYIVAMSGVRCEVVSLEA